MKITRQDNEISCGLVKVSLVLGLAEYGRYYKVITAVTIFCEMYKS